jgi:hypothetical protein
MPVSNLWHQFGAGTEDVATKLTVTLEKKTVLEADIYVPATGSNPNTNFIQQAFLTAEGHVDTNTEVCGILTQESSFKTCYNSSLPHELCHDGVSRLDFVYQTKTDSTKTLRVDKAGPRIYAIGDVASYARPAIHTIFTAIPVLCANIKRDLLLSSGKAEISASNDRVFREDTRETQLVPIGKSKGVGAAMGFQLPSFLIWLVKGRDYWLWTTGDLWSGKQWAKEV